MADEKIVKVGGDIGTNIQDQRGKTGRMIDAGKLRDDIDKGIEGGTGDEPVALTPEEARALQAQVRRANQRADAAEARAAESDGKVGDVLDAKTISDLNTLKTSKAMLEGQRDTLKKQLSAAHADGDFDAIADINTQMMQTTVNLTNIEGGIVALENSPKQAEAMRQRGEPGNMRFRQITKTMSPPAKQWFRDNPEYWQDAKKLNRVIAAHQMVMTSDDPPEIDSDEYFTAVQAELKDPKFTAGSRTGTSGGQGGGDGGDDDGGDEALSQASGGNRRDTPPASAPPARNGRGAGGAANPTGREARLSAQEREAARDSGLTDEEYLANKRQLIADERMGPAYRRNMH